MSEYVNSIAGEQVLGGIELRSMENKRSDESDLNRIGKKGVLKRNFGFMSILGFSCTVVITWEAFCFVFAIGLENGGPAGVIYGYIFVWLGTLAVFATLAEATSMAPTSGGQYHWVSMLSPLKCHKFLSYITGWFLTLGWQASVASNGYLIATMMRGLIILTDPSYEPQPWHIVLLYWGICLFGVLINTVVSNWLPKLEGLILILHVVGFFAVLFPMVILGSRSEPSRVFGTFLNLGNWPAKGLSFFVGLLGNVYTFFGADGAIHMSEEIQNAAIVVPRAIMSSILLNGVMGFGIALALLFCMGDVEAILGTSTGYPSIEIFRQAVQSITGAALMAAVIITMALCATLAVMASASRQLWAFSRDRAVPGWQHLQHVDSKSSIPIIAVMTTVVISCLLSLIILGSSAAFNGVVSLSVVGLFGSYLITALLLFWRRLRGDIKLPTSSEAAALTNVPGAQLTWGPWRLPGALGIITNGFAIIYLIIIFFFVQWPLRNPPEPATMNYSSLMFGATMLFSMIYYVLRARKRYHGPVIEVIL